MAVCVTFIKNFMNPLLAHPYIYNITTKPAEEPFVSFNNSNINVNKKLSCGCDSGSLTGHTAHLAHRTNRRLVYIPLFTSLVVLDSIFQCILWLNDTSCSRSA